MALLFNTFQFFDNVGLPLSGGKIYTYAAGTTTAKASYTTVAEDVVHTNPIILDQRGMVEPHGLWFQGSYKLVVKDSLDSTLHTLDYVKGYDAVDFTGTTVTVTQLNTATTALPTTAGTVTASKLVVVDANADISAFRNLTSVNLTASALTTPVLQDANAVKALTITATASQLNSIIITPAITGGDVDIAPDATEASANLLVTGQGTGKVVINSLKYPTADGSPLQLMTTNGSGVLGFRTSPTGSTLTIGSVLYSTATISAPSIAITLADTIPLSTHGLEVMSLAFTPTSSISTLIISGIVYVRLGNPATCVATLNQLNVSNSLMAMAHYGNPDIINGIPFCISVPSVSTSSRTYTVRISQSSSAGAIAFNEFIGGTTDLGSKMSSYLMVRETST